MKAIITVTNQVRKHGTPIIKAKSKNIGSVRALNRATDGEAVPGNGGNDSEAKTPNKETEVHSWISRELDVKEVGTFLNRFERGTPSCNAEVRAKQMNYSALKKEVLEEANLSPKTNIGKLPTLEASSLSRKLAPANFRYYVIQCIIEVLDDEGNVTNTIRSKKRMSLQPYPKPNGWEVRKKQKKPSTSESES